MNPLVAEFFGTMILVLLGDGVCANVSLAKTKGSNAGWLAISTGWGLAVFIGVVCSQEYSGAHINPAVTAGLAAAGRFGWTESGQLDWGLLGGYVACQMAGGFVAAVLMYLFYHQHFRVTDDPNLKLGTFCTTPAIRGGISNFFCELVGTFVLVITVLLAASATLTVNEGNLTGTHEVGLGSVGALPVGLLVFAIGISLGGTTGYAINPARDLSPRIAHAMLPIPGKRDSDWSYSWIPVVGPLAGGLVAAVVYRMTTL